MRAELEKLVDLQKTDTNIRRLKKSIDTTETGRAGIEQEFEEHAFSIRQIQNRRDSLNTARADLDKQIAENKTYLERADRNLKHAQNQKEYETAMRETDALQKQIAALETQDLEKMGELETVDKELEERADEINTLEGKRKIALGEFDSQVAKNKKELEKEVAHRKEIFVTLPERLAEVYDRLSVRGRDGIAVAEVINGACSACFMSLRPQMQLEVKKGEEIITCESCSRILFSQPKTLSATKES